VTGAIGISADVETITMQLLPELAQQVIAAADQISSTLSTAGYYISAEPETE
jgi:DNA-binding IclR family transcriptional regulator